MATANRLDDRRRVVEAKATKPGRGLRRRVPRTHDPERIREIAREAGYVIKSPDFVLWYSTWRCEGAPSFSHFWGYVRRSLTYDLPGRELAGIIFEATSGAFQTFDAARGDAGRPIEGRFLKHWRCCFANVARKVLRRDRWLPLESEFAAARPDERLRREVAVLVEVLSPTERLLLRLRHWEDMTFADMGKTLHMRKADVVREYDKVISKLREIL